MAAAVSQRSTAHAQEMIDHREIVSAQIIVLREQLAQAQAATAAATPVETIEPTFLTQGKIVMVVGNLVAAVLSIGLQGDDTALCDDGATIDCFLTTDGMIHPKVVRSR